MPGSFVPRIHATRVRQDKFSQETGHEYSDDVGFSEDSAYLRSTKLSIELIFPKWSETMDQTESMKAAHEKYDAIKVIVRLMWMERKAFIHDRVFLYKVNLSKIARAVHPARWEAPPDRPVFTAVAKKRFRKEEVIGLIAGVLTDAKVNKSDPNPFLFEMGRGSILLDTSQYANELAFLQDCQGFQEGDQKDRVNCAIIPFVLEDHQIMVAAVWACKPIKAGEELRAARGRIFWNYTNGHVTDDLARYAWLAHDALKCRSAPKKKRKMSEPCDTPTSSQPPPSKRCSSARRSLMPPPADRLPIIPNPLDLIPTPDLPPTILLHICDSEQTHTMDALYPTTLIEQYITPEPIDRVLPPKQAQKQRRKHA